MLMRTSNPSGEENRFNQPALILDVTKLSRHPKTVRVAHHT
jgi:hypothetical protein